jgi:hypothetical protein
MVVAPMIAKAVKIMFDRDIRALASLPGKSLSF